MEKEKKKVARTKKPKSLARVEKGSHLTITYNDEGKVVNMEWDWDKLAEEINNAIHNLHHHHSKKLDHKKPLKKHKASDEKKTEKKEKREHKRDK